MNKQKALFSIENNAFSITIKSKLQIKAGDK